MLKKILFSFFIFLICFWCHAEKVYDFSIPCQQAYQEILKLKINNGLAILQAAKKQNPDNLIPLYLESYADFLTLFLNEDPEYYKQQKDIMSDRISQLKEGNNKSPLYYHILSVVYLHRAIVEVKFGENWSAGWDFKKAYQYAKDNQKKFPDFSPNQLNYGCLQAVAGTIPKSYQWLAGLFGINGSLSKGMASVKNFVYSTDPYAKLYNIEANFFYTYLQFYLENNKPEALQFIRTQKLDIVNNHLYTFMAANLAINNKEMDYAKQTINNRNKSVDYLKTTIWDFELAHIKICHLELPEAIMHYQQFINNFKGKFYLKEVYLKLAWCYYLQGNMSAAEANRKNAIKKGSADSDADKKALKEAKTGVWPNALLLKTRLLNDGGYNKEALSLIAGKSSNDFNELADKLEFAYRYARILDDMGNKDAAIKAYDTAIALGRNRTEHYAARAAMQAGIIFEEKGQKLKAIEYYELCLSMDDHDYKSSIDQRAKAGIARCKGK